MPASSTRPYCSTNLAWDRGEDRRMVAGRRKKWMRAMTTMRMKMALKKMKMMQMTLCLVSYPGRQYIRTAAGLADSHMDGPRLPEGTM